MKVYLFLLATLFSLSTYAQTTKEHVYIHGYSREAMAFFASYKELTIDHATAYGFELYGPDGLKAWLDKEGISYSQYPDQKTMMSNLPSYPSYEQITAELKNLAYRNPHIFSLFSIGQSVEGRELWVMKVSDNVMFDEVEPEFKYISSMHGDEITGRELMITLLQEMAANYGTDRELTHLINNTEIYIMPSMNPDGSEKKQRGNANWVDLNRNFPDVWDLSTYNDKREVETVVVMNFQASRQFSLSANFHGGAVVANYPWDANYERHPFNDLLIELALGYSRRNPEMYNSPVFPDGITNGADWYIVKGGMQDWSYVFYNDLQVTIELSDVKWPDYQTIPEFYVRNRNSIVHYMKAVHQGGGFILSHPGVEGVVEIFDDGGRSLGQFLFRNSEFYKVLEPGKYTFNISYAGTYRTIEVDVEKDYIYNGGNYQVVF